MKTFIIALSFFFAANSMSFAQNKSESSKKEAQKSTFTCPDHRDVTSDTPGKCSKCGMKLVEVSTLKHNPAIKGSQATTSKEMKYVCPMHKDKTSDKKGNCPKCGMPMIENKDKGTEKENKEHHEEHKDK